MSSQRTLSLDFREFGTNDYDRLAVIYNANYPDYAVSAAEQRARDNSLDKSKYLLKRVACLDTGTGAVLGFGVLSHVLDMYHPQKLMMNILVDPDHQKMGVGSAIFQRLLNDLENLDAEIVWTMNKEDLPLHREFFQRRGFEEKRRDWESRLDLGRLDASGFHDYPSKMEREGINFTTLAIELKNGDSSLRGLHDLVQHIAEDMPRQADYTPVPYEQWKALELNSPRLLPEGYVIAKDGSHFVGLSVVYKNAKAPRILTQGDTGVRREYRGRGIATAMKLKIIDFAKQHGYERIETWNDQSNAAMLAVNMKLGFRKHVAWILLEKDLTGKN